MHRRAVILSVAAGLLLPLAGSAQDAPLLVWTKPDQFWFRKAVAGGNLWLNVDAAHSVKEPLFDHQRLAIELGLRTGLEYTPLTLPFADPAARFVVKYDGSNAYIQEGAMAIEFILNGSFWRCELQVKWDWNKVPPTDYECLPRRPAPPGAAADPAAAVTSSVSPDGTWEALIDNHNVAIRPKGQTTLKPLTTDGTAANAWQAGSIRWAADSAGLSAYRVDAQVWLSPGVSGSVKSLVQKGAWNVR